MKILAFLLLTVAVLVAGYATSDLLRPRLASRAASGVHIGDTRSQVLAALGQPARTRPVVPIRYTHLGFPQPVLWCYGRKYDWHHPLSRQFPYIVRLVEDDWSFYPELDDVVVEFDGGGKVASIRIPKP